MMERAEKTFYIVNECSDFSDIELLLFCHGPPGAHILTLTTTTIFGPFQDSLSAFKRPVMFGLARISNPQALHLWVGNLELS